MKEGHTVIEMKYGQEDGLVERKHFLFSKESGFEVYYNRSTKFLCLGWVVKLKFNRWCWSGIYLVWVSTCEGPSFALRTLLLRMLSPRSDVLEFENH